MFDDFNPSKYQGVTLDSAKIKLYVKNVEDANAVDVSAYRVLENWNESLITHNSQPATSGTIVTRTVTTADDWRRWDITDILNGWINGTYDNYGIKQCALKTVCDLIGIHWKPFPVHKHTNRLNYARYHDDGWDN